MKKTLLYILAVLFLFSCTQKQTNQGPQKTILTGHVTNFSEVADHDFIEFIYEDILASQTKKVANIDLNGNFRFDLDLDYPTEFYLKYSALVTLFIAPGDSVHITIDGACWESISETYAEEYGYYHPAGDKAQMNSEILKYNAFFRDSISNWPYHDSIIRNCDPMEYAILLEEMTTKEKEFVEGFNKTNLTSNDFRKWVDAEVKFKQWSDLMRYCWLHPMHNGMQQPGDYVDSIPTEYFDFLEDWDPEDKSLLANMEYLSFLYEYWLHENHFTIENEWADLDRKDPDIENKIFSIRKAHISAMKPGFLRDVLLAKLSYMFLDSKKFELFKNNYVEGEIADEVLANRIQTRYNYEKDLFENPEFAAGTHFNQLSSENEFMQDLIAKYPEKVIFIDFWAPWCSPCMGEMPSAKKMKEKFEGKDVVFVYLGNQCEEAAWKSTIAEKKIEGEHYLLTDKQFAELSEIFDVKGIPHYGLVDKQGIIVNTNAPRPSTGEVLEKAIDKLL